MTNLFSLRAICIISVLCGCVLSAQSADQPQKPAQFETRADVVLVDVNVIDRDGNPVHNLSAADFVLEVNGQPRPIHTLQFISTRGTDTVATPARLEAVSRNDAASSGRLLLFVIDENYLKFGSARAILRTAERVLDTLAPGDLVGLTRLPTGRGSVEFTTDRNRIKRALAATTGQQPARSMDKVRLSEALAFDRKDTNVWEQVVTRECGSTDGGGGDFAREACERELEAQANFVITDASARTDTSIRGFEQLATRLTTVNAPVNVVLLSEGLFVGRDRNNLTHLAQLAARARMSFFIVQPDESIFDMDKPKVTGAFGDEQALAEGLEQLAGLTRGEYFRTTTSGAGAFQRIAREISGYYLLGFEPTEADRTSKDRKIKVELKRRGLTVRARSTYAVSAAVDANAALAPPEHIKNLLLAPLPSAGLPMRIATYTVNNPGDSRVRVIVSAEMGEAATDAVEWPVGLIVIDKNDKIVVESNAPMRLAPASARAASPRLLLTSILLEPGEYTLRLAAIGNNGAAGSVHHTIDARLGSVGNGDVIKASDLILTSPMGAGETPRPTPSSVIDTEQLTAVVELTSTDYQRLGSAKVRVQIAESEKSPALVTSDMQVMPRNDELRAFATTMKLTMLPPGEYVARAIVTMPGQPDTRILRSFRLDPVAAPKTTAVAAPRNPDEAVPLPAARIAAPLHAFKTEDVLKPDVVRTFIDALQKGHPVSAAHASIVQQAREGTFVVVPPDVKASLSDEPTLNFIRGLAMLQKKQNAQAAAWFQLTLKGASDFLGSAFYLGAVHAALGRDTDAVGAWQLSLLNDENRAVYPHLVDALLRIGDGQGALELIAEAPDAWSTDEERLRRVVTAQAMLGQFTPALETLHPLLRKLPNDVDLLFIAIQVLYKQHGEGALSSSDRARFDDYSARYIAADGPAKPLVETWRKYVLSQ